MSNDFDNKNLPQISPNRNIARASKQLATVNKALTTINREKFIKFLERNKDAAAFFILSISKYSNVLDMDLIEQYSDQFPWWGLSGNESLPWSESLIERFADKWDWGDLSGSRYENKAVMKLFNSWTKQEVSTALERIRSAYKDLPHV